MLRRKYLRQPLGHYEFGLFGLEFLALGAHSGQLAELAFHLGDEHLWMYSSAGKTV